jgi:anti-sigma B factor antagonist
VSGKDRLRSANEREEPIVGSAVQDRHSPVPLVASTRRSEYSLVVATRGSPWVRVVEAVGSIDMHTAPELADHLSACLADGTPLIVVVDLRQVDFLAAAGLSVLVESDSRARAQDITLRVVATTHAVCRALSITGLDQTLRMYSKLEAALAV